MRVRTLVVLALTATIQAQRVGAPTDDLTNLSVDDLFQIQVTSVGKKAQELSSAPAAVFVLTSDDIRRTGATSIPEALQWVPGLTVLSIDGRSWAISARGSASLYADKMLVLIDGRSLYTPLFAGVMWDALDVPLENIDRIEVMRGPGAVMWGPNAVNGVINIITKTARQTAGAEVSVATGNDLHGEIFGRWSIAPNDKFAIEIWAKADDRNPAFGSPGAYSFDSGFIVQDPRRIDDLTTESARIGFRIDGDPSKKDHLVFQGDLYKIGERDDLAYPILVPLVIDPEVGHIGYTGGFIQASWTRTASADKESTLQFTMDRGNITYPFIDGTVNNMTVDYQRRQSTGERNEVFWGGGYQQYWDDTQELRYVGFNPLDAVYRVGDLVVRDEFQLLPNRLTISAGMRVDYSSYTRFEFQPSVRLSYTPNRRQTLWAAFSRAERIPSRFENDMDAQVGQMLVGGYPININETGNRSFLSETERSVEAGYRRQSGQVWSFDAAVFWSQYTHLRTLMFPAQPDISFANGVPALSMTLKEVNGGTGRSYGGETSATWQVMPKWRLLPAYSYLDEARWLPPGMVWDFRDSGARHQVLLRSQHDLTRKLQLDLMARARSRIIAFDLPGTVLFDARLSWRLSPRSEFSVSVKDLTGRETFETYSQIAFVAIPSRRTIVFRWRQSF